MKRLLIKLIRQENRPYYLLTLALTAILFQQLVRLGFIPPFVMDVTNTSVIFLALGLTLGMSAVLMPTIRSHGLESQKTPFFVLWIITSVLWTAFAHVHDATLMVYVNWLLCCLMSVALYCKLSDITHLIWLWCYPAVVLVGLFYAKPVLQQYPETLNVLLGCAEPLAYLYAFGVALLGVPQQMSAENRRYTWIGFVTLALNYSGWMVWSYDYSAPAVMVGIALAILFAFLTAIAPWLRRKTPWAQRPFAQLAGW